MTEESKAAEEVDPTSSIEDDEEADASEDEDDELEGRVGPMVRDTPTHTKKGNSTPPKNYTVF